VPGLEEEPGGGGGKNIAEGLKATGYRSGLFWFCT
jgi:hypothetical protein